jgi:hypothetical protein
MNAERRRGENSRAHVDLRRRYLRVRLRCRWCCWNKRSEWDRSEWDRRGTSPRDTLSFSLSLSLSPTPTQRPQRRSRLGCVPELPRPSSMNVHPPSVDERTSSVVRCKSVPLSSMNIRPLSVCLSVNGCPSRCRRRRWMYVPLSVIDECASRLSSRRWM